MLHPSIVEKINLSYKSQLWTTHYELLSLVRNFSVLFAIRELGRETKKYSWQSLRVTVTNWCIYRLISVCWCSRRTCGRPFLHCLCSRWSMPTRKPSGRWLSWRQLSGCHVKSLKVTLSMSSCSVQWTSFKLPSESIHSHLCSRLLSDFVLFISWWCCLIIWSQWCVFALQNEIFGSCFTFVANAWWL